MINMKSIFLYEKEFSENLFTKLFQNLSPQIGKII
jgi:hypothetical protein